MEKCKICGFEGKLEDDKCGFCQREKGIPGGDRVKQAIRELPKDWFTTTMATNLLPYYFSYTVKLLKRMEMIDFLETKGDPKQFKLTKKALKYVDLKVQEKKEDDKVDGGLRRKKNKFNSEKWKVKIEQIVKENPGCGINQIKIEGLGKKRVYAYLSELVENGVLYTQIDPNDKRKKIYFHEETRKAVYDTGSLPPEVQEWPQPKCKVEFKDSFKEKEDEIINQPDCVKVEMVNSMPTMGQLLDKVWPYCTSATPRKPTNRKNQESEALVAQFSDQKSLLNIFNDLSEELQDKTRITLDPQNGKNQLIIPIIGAEA